MAAPTNVRVEANSISTTILRWSYSGANFLGVYRSTNGSAYTLITTPALLAPATQSYTDTGLSTGTKYWYKVSDDGGSTFSSVVTVFTHECVAPATGGDGFSLPRMSHGGGDPVDEFNDAAQRIENVLQGRVLDPQDCAVCPEDGAIVIDCSDGCRSFVVIADQDINSISIQMCDEGDGRIDFIIPPNVTRKICGFPSGFGFTGDECNEAPIFGGSAGRTMSVGMNGARANPAATKSRPGYGGGAGRGAGGAGGGGGCACVPNGIGQLTIKSCNANNSLNCFSTKSLKLIACGGKPPYTWSKTGSIQLSAASGSSTTVTPPANSGSGVGGTAYMTMGAQKTGGGCTTAPLDGGRYGCNDQLLTACSTTSLGCSPAGAALCRDSSCSDPNLPVCNSPDWCAQISQTCDVRSAGMITDGCNPCGVAMAGATVSVTDSVGVQTTIILGV